MTGTLGSDLTDHSSARRTSGIHPKIRCAQQCGERIDDSCALSSQFVSGCLQDLECSVDTVVESWLASRSAANGSTVVAMGKASIASVLPMRCRVLFAILAASTAMYPVLVTTA